MVDSIYFNNCKKVICVLEVFDKIGYSILILKEKLVCFYDYYLLGLEIDCVLLYECIN